MNLHVQQPVNIKIFSYTFGFYSTLNYEKFKTTDLHWTRFETIEMSPPLRIFRSKVRRD